MPRAGCWLLGAWQWRPRPPPHMPPLTNSHNPRPPQGPTKQAAIRNTTMANRKRPLRSACLLLPSALLVRVPSGHSVRITPQTFHEHVTADSNSNAATTTVPQPQRRTLSSLDLPTPKDHLVTSLPLLEPGSFPTRQWAGLLPLSQTDDDKYLFYWLIEPDFSNTADELSQDDPAQVPLIIWLNGE